MTTQSMTLVAPYSHDFFHQIQDVGDVMGELKTKDSNAFVHTTLAPIFKKHYLEEVLGVGLVHRHFSISPNEKLVEFNNITTPWSGIKLSSNHSAKIPNSANGLVTETSWVLDANDKWMPFEFSFDPQGTTTVVNLEDAQYQEFLREYTTALKQNGFDKILGLTAWPGAGYTGGLEFCSGRGNIVLTPDQTTAEDGNANNVQTAWFWHPEWLQPYKGKKKSNRCCCDKAGPHGAKHAEWLQPQQEMKKSKRCCCDKAGPHGAHHAEWEQPQQEVKEKECTVTRAGHITTLSLDEAEAAQPLHDELKSKLCSHTHAGDDRLVKSKLCPHGGRDDELVKGDLETNGGEVQGMKTLSLKCHVSAAGHHECT